MELQNSFLYTNLRQPLPHPPKKNENKKLKVENVSLEMFENYLIASACKKQRCELFTCPCPRVLAANVFFLFCVVCISCIYCFADSMPLLCVVYVNRFYLSVHLFLSYRLLPIFIYNLLIFFMFTVECNTCVCWILTQSLLQIKYKLNAFLLRIFPCPWYG